MKRPLAEVVPYNPQFCILTLSTACNLRCNYCARQCVGDSGWDVPEGLYQRQLETLRDIDGLRMVNVTGYGEFIISGYRDEVLAICKEKGLGIILFTNGVALSEQRLQQLIDSGLKVINLSIITFESSAMVAISQRDHVERVLEAGRMLSRMRPGLDGQRHYSLQISMVLNEYNVHEISEM